MSKSTCAACAACANLCNAQLHKTYSLCDVCGAVGPHNAQAQVTVKETNKTHRQENASLKLG